MKINKLKFCIIILLVSFVYGCSTNGSGSSSFVSNSSYTSEISSTNSINDSHSNSEHISSSTSSENTSEIISSDSNSSTNNSNSEHIHNWVESDRIEATCTNEGVIFYVCDGCDAEKNEKIQPKGHKEVIDEAVSPTCTSKGLTEGSHCSVCGEVLIEQVEISEKGHQFSEVMYTWSSDNKSVIATRKCLNDGTHIEEEKVDTTYKVVIPATCTSKGKAQWVSESFNNKAFKVQTKDVELEMLEHIVVEIPSISPTCTEVGYTSGEKCSVCGTVIVEPKEICSYGHDIIYHNSKNPTCTSIGWNAYETCSRCNYTTYEELDKVGHTYGEALLENKVESTCTSKGSYDMVIYCSVCDEEISRKTYVTSEIGHNEEVIPSVSPTCLSTGLTAGVKCSICGEILVKQEVIPVNDHTPSEAKQENVISSTCKKEGSYDSVVYCSECNSEISRVTITTPVSSHNHETIPEIDPSCDTEGYTSGVKCSECGEVLIAPEKIDALGHNYVEDVCDKCGHNYYTEGLQFSLNGNEYYVSDYTGLSIDVVVPAIYNDKPVTAIYNGAFDFTGSIRSVKLPSSIKIIGQNAFYNCSSLESIVIPRNVTSIGGTAFAYCNSLKDLTIPDSVEAIGNNAFYKCDKLENITIPALAMPYIPVSSLKTVAITSGDTLASGSLKEAVSLTSLTISDSVTNIEGNLFENIADYYQYFTYVKLPSSALPYINSSCLKTVIITSGEIFDGALKGFSRVEEITLPKDITSIGDNAFSYCGALETITLPNSIVTIGNSAFYSCDSLKSIFIPEGVISIGSHAFNGCRSLESIVLPSSLRSIGDSAFYWCDSLKSIVIPEGVTSIGNKTFYNCQSLDNIVIPNSVTNIYSYNVFEGCNSISTFSGPYSALKYISVSSLKTVVITSGDVGDALKNTSWLTTVTLLDGVTGINSNAFNNCKNLKNIEIPNSVTKIGMSAFAGCSSLTNINIPNSVTVIGSYAFSNCSSLESITISDSVTNIGGQAFEGCDSLSTIYYQGTEEQWNSITINSGNESLLNANVIFNCH